MNQNEERDFIIEAVTRAKVPTVHPDAQNTIDIGRAVLAAYREKTTNTTASIDLAQLDKKHVQTLSELLICCLSWQPQVCVLGNVRAGDAAAAIQDALARRSLTSGVSAGRVIDSDPGCGQSLIDVALEPGTAIYRAPVHGAAAPSAEQGSYDAPLDIHKHIVNRYKAELLAGAAAKTDHAPAGVGAWVNDPPEVFPWDKEDRAAAVKFYQDNPGAALFDFEQRIRDRKEKVEQASAAGAGGDQASTAGWYSEEDGEAYTHPSYGPGVFFTEDCVRSPASVTVQDERALREAVRAVVQLVQNGEWADLLHTDPDAVALWDAVDGLLRRAAHPVQDGEKDAQAATTENHEWMPLTGPGQIVPGDHLRFTTGGQQIEKIAHLVLEAGTDGEEVVYDVRNNFYFITDMAVAGESHAKNVEYRAAMAAAQQNAKGEQRADQA